MTGSFCTFSKAFSAMEALRDAGCDILPIMSLSAGTVDTRFGTAQEHIKRAENICGKRVIMSVADAEPIGPKRLTDIMIVAPCTGNTMAKLARSITDTPVTMAVKSHLRGARPVLIACATNDSYELQKLLLRSARTGRSAEEALLIGCGFFADTAGGRCGTGE